MRDVQRVPGARRAGTRIFRRFDDRRRHPGRFGLTRWFRFGLRTFLWPVLLTLPALACSSALRGYDVAPNGLDRNDDHLRRMVASGAADSALIRLQPSNRGIAPTDPVLRLLYHGTVAYHAGDYSASVSAFDSAAWLADDRTVTSVSREAAALLSNERALPYQPNRTDRLFNAYYAALAYLRMDDLEDAAVEARRISYILEDSDEGVDTREAPLHGLLRYLSGVLYETAGDLTNAAVAYRNAQALLPTLSPPLPLKGDSGDVVLLIEDGFVAHRVQHSLTLVLGDDEHDRLYARDRRLRAQAADDLAVRVLASAFDSADAYGVGPRTGRRDWFVGAPPRPHDQRPDDGRRSRAHCRERPKSRSTAADTTSSRSEPASTNATKAGSDSAPRGRRKGCDDDDRTYILRMTWPSYHADRLPALSGRILYGDTTEIATPVFASVNAAILAEYERDRPAMLARLITRTAAKYALVKGAESAGGEDNEGLGRILGRIANVSTAVLEQADTRSWALLPGGIGIARIRLPRGTHGLQVVVGSRTVRVPRVEVEAGGLRVEGVRVNGP